MARKVKRESQFSCGRRRCFSLSQQPGHKRHAATSRSTPPRTRAERCHLLDPPSGFTGNDVHFLWPGHAPHVAPRRHAERRCARRPPPHVAPNALTSCVARGDISSWQGRTLASNPATPTAPPCSVSCHARGDIMSCHGWHHVVPTPCHAIMSCQGWHHPEVTLSARGSTMSSWHGRRVQTASCHARVAIMSCQG